MLGPIRILLASAAAALLVLLAAPPPPAQAAAAADAPACPASAGETWTAQRLFGLTADWPHAEGAGPRQPREFPMHPRSQGVAGRESLVVEIGDLPAQATFLAAARRRPRSRQAEPDEYEPARAAVETVAGGKVTLRLEAPRNRTNWFGERWLFAVAVCAEGRLAGYGLTELAVNPRNLSRALAAGLIGLLYLGIVVAVWQCNAGRLQARWRGQAEEDGIPVAAPLRRPRGADALDSEAGRLAWARRIGWKLSHAINPVFVSQDAAGFGSLGRLQLLIFSLVVGFVALNIYFATGAIAELGDDVLNLLGISVIAAATSRLVPSNSGLSAANRLWIAQRRVLLPSGRRLALWRDIISADGEIDVTRVQAVIFTLLVAMALAAKGAGDLSSFQVSEEVQYLLGLSQVAYVAGKAIPTEAVKRLDEAISAIRAAETLAARAAADGAERFELAKAGAGSALAEIYGRRFRAEEFQGLQPLASLPAVEEPEAG